MVWRKIALKGRNLELKRMNGCERFISALRKEEPDRVPIWELIVNQPVVEGIMGAGGTYVDLCNHLDLDGVTCGEDQRLSWISGDEYTDEWGIRWRVGAGGLSYPVGGPIRDKEDITSYEAPDPDADWRLKTLEEFVRRFKGKRAIVFLGHESFEFSHYLVGGMRKLFLLYAREPDYAFRLADIISRYKLAVMERAVEVGADVLLTGDDYCNAHGPFMRPEQFRKFVLPYLERAVGCARKMGVPFIKHTDGYLWPIIGDLVDCGIDGLHPIEPAARMDIGEVKSKFGGRICVIGNIDCSYILSMGSLEEVRVAVKKVIAKASPGGGHIISSSNSIHPGVKPENFLEMVRVAKEYGKYPIDEKLIKEFS